MLQKCSFNFISIFTCAFKYGEGLLYIETEHLFTSLVYFSISFHFHLLKKTDALYLQAVLSPHRFLLTNCALATTFIILLKFFVHQISKATLCQIHWPTESSTSSSFLIYWNTVFLQFFLLLLAWTVLFRFLTFCSNKFLSRMCSDISHPLRPTDVNLSTVIEAYIRHSWSSVRPFGSRRLSFTFLDYSCVYMPLVSTRACKSL